uniref:Slc39a-12 n=1 Tax=Schmidtea mediterranea TaxID=79327 RepID=A0A0H3YFM2_SCHMD|nr:slc39a-12 [Schmidtea mediterranea]
MRHFSFVDLLAFFISLLMATESTRIDNEICFSKSSYDNFVDLFGNLFLNFSLQNAGDLMKNKLSKANFSTECLARRFVNSTPELQKSTFEGLIAMIVDKVIIPHCNIIKLNSPSHSKCNLSSLKMWVYGFISVTIINACAGLGILFIPLMNKKFYKVLMTFMISLAVGSLTGSALLILIPDAMQLAELQHGYPGYQVSYKYKATVVFGGVYMFFLLERFLKWIINKEVRTFNRANSLSHGSLNISRTPKPKLEIDQINSDNHLIVAPEMKTTLNNHCNNKPNNNEVIELNLNSTDIPKIKYIKKKPVAPVAWMIIFGDALHNFIDGLSIGAAFSHNTMTGISLSIAVICEELPHELGDFAILLNAGMNIKQALMWNMLSAATCYIGFIIGVILGETTSGSTWVFAVAGGMFLYINV